MCVRSICRCDSSGRPEVSGGYSRTPVIVVLLCLALPCLAARWQEVGSPGVSTDKIMVDTDSVQSVGDLRVALIMTVYTAPRTNAHNILLDKHVQKTAFDCANRKFVGIQTLGYLNNKQVGSGPETDDWKNKLVPLKNDPLTNRVVTLVCSQPVNSDKSPDGTVPGAASKPKFLTGSGIILNNAGDVLTNSHVTKGCKAVLVKGMNAGPVPAKLDAVDPKNDLALLKTGASPSIGTPAAFRRPSKPAK